MTAETIPVEVHATMLWALKRWRTSMQPDDLLRAMLEAPVVQNWLADRSTRPAAPAPNAPWYAFEVRSWSTDETGRKVWSDWRQDVSRTRPPEGDHVRNVVALVPAEPAAIFPEAVRQFLVYSSWRMPSAVAAPHACLELRALRRSWIAAIEAIGLTEEEARESARGLYRRAPPSDASSDTIDSMVPSGGSRRFLDFNAMLHHAWLAGSSRSEDWEDYDPRGVDAFERIFTALFPPRVKLGAPPSDADKIAAAALDMLFDLAGAAYKATVEVEETGPVGESIYRLRGEAFERLVDALDKLDELPDDQPGVIMGPAAKAAWALRAMRAALPTAKPEGA